MAEPRIGSNWGRRLGFGPEFIGLLNGSGQPVWAVCALPAAAVSRRIGLRWAPCAGLALTAALIIGYWRLRSADGVRPAPAS